MLTNLEGKNQVSRGTHRSPRREPQTQGGEGAADGGYAARPAGELLPVKT